MRVPGSVNLDKAAAVAGRVAIALKAGGLPAVKDTGEGGWPAFVLTRSMKSTDYATAPSIVVRAPRGRTRLYIRYLGKGDEPRDREMEASEIPMLVARLREWGALRKLDAADLSRALEGRLYEHETPAPRKTEKPADVADGRCDFCGERGMVATSEQGPRHSEVSICGPCVTWARDAFRKAGVQ